MNRFMYHEEVVRRLCNNYDEHNSLIIAVDFDNTIYDFHKDGLDVGYIIELVRRAMKAGLEVYIFSANSDHKLIKEYCIDHFGEELPINQSSIDKQFDSTKPYYSLLLDDRAGLCDSVAALEDVLNYIV